MYCGLNTSVLLINVLNKDRCVCFKNGLANISLKVLFPGSPIVILNSLVVLLYPNWSCTDTSNTNFLSTVDLLPSNINVPLSNCVSPIPEASPNVFILPDIDPFNKSDNPGGSLPFVSV